MSYFKTEQSIESPLKSSESIQNDLISRKGLVEWLLSNRYIRVNEDSTEMTEEYEKEHSWELSRNTFINKAVKHIKEASTSDDMTTIMELLSGKWVDSNRVQKALGMDFSECFAMFDFARTAEWWSLVGKTKEERARNGQKVSTYFRVKIEK